MANITVSNAFDKQLYMEDLVKTAENNSFWKQLAGGESSVVNVDRRPEKGGGAACNYALRPYLVPRSVTNGPLDGQERQLSYFKDSLTLDKHREAVIDDGEQQEIEAFFSISGSMESYIKQWATDIYDALHFKAIFYEGGNPNLYSPNAKTKATLTTAETMGKDDLSQLYTVAMTGQSRAFEPLRPINVGGKNVYVYLCHPDVARDIRLDLESDWASAMPRSTGNPLFQNMTLMWSDVIVMADRRCPIELGGSGGAVPIATSALLGQQAIQQIMGKDFDMVSGDKDWGDQKGYAAKYIMGCKAPEFNSSRYGSILVSTARTNVSGDDNLSEINYSAIDTSNQ
jgi:N4-gp56 family major capsid protein